SSSVVAVWSTLSIVPWESIWGVRARIKPPGTYTPGTPGAAKNQRKCPKARRLPLSDGQRPGDVPALQFLVASCVRTDASEIGHAARQPISIKASGIIDCRHGGCL